MPDVALHLGDAVKWARDYKGEPFHALLCDPPYHLTDPRDPRRASPSASQRANRSRANGFMGKQWDGGDAAFNPETWEAFKSIMYPGAFGMAFASSRGWHRLAVAIEDAGFVIHPSIFGWAYGSGFPKATRVKQNTVFSGHRYGLQALKPALEPVIVFQKPYEGRPIDNITETGAGVLNVDGGRIPYQSEAEFEYVKAQTENGWKSRSPGAITRNDKGMFDEGRDGTAKIAPSGRWPANFYLDAEAARRLDEQSGTLTSGSLKPYKEQHKNASSYHFDREKTYAKQGDSGGASRFFFTVREQIDEADPVFYCAKASRRERNEGLDNKELVRYNQTNQRKEGLTWENTESAEVTQADWDTSPQRDTTESPSGTLKQNPQDKSLPTSGSGNSKTGRSRRATKSTTSTATNLTTDCKISNSLTVSPTNESTADAIRSTGNGTSPVANAGNTSSSVLNTGTCQKRDGLCTDDAESATSSKWSTINVHVRQEEKSNSPLNNHPCIKPLALTKYLATLLLPPEEYAPRRLFIPFSGVASECIGAMQTGWEEVVGVELTEEYLPIAQARVDYWKEKEHA